MLHFQRVFLLIAALFLTGCASSVKYGDPTAVETVNIQFGSSDLQQIAAKMVDSMLTFPTVTDITRSRRPILYVEGVRNKTQEHIDMESITDTIVSKLLRSAQFQFVDKTTRGVLQDELDYQKGSGFVDPQTAAKIGRQLGAEYMLHGNLSSIVKSSGSTRDVYYKFTLKMINLERGLLIWQDEKEIRKQLKRSIFGL
jgi:uncharacterized protein (TIGR02722 family)